MVNNGILQYDFSDGHINLSRFGLQISRATFKVSFRSSARATSTWLHSLAENQSDPADPTSNVAIGDGSKLGYQKAWMIWMERDG